MKAAPIASIHQPHYFPWLGLVAKIACSDIYVVLDNVQFEKNGWQNRTRYSTSAGLQFLTLPVRQSGIVSRHISILDVELADSNASTKHWKTLSQRYGKRPGWRRIAERLESILTARHKRLFPLCQETTDLTLELFHVRPNVVYASTIPVEGTKGERVVNLTKAVRAAGYLSGVGAKEYLDPAAFACAGLSLDFQQFSHPRYGQSHGGEFVPAALALEWYFEDPDGAPEAFRHHLNTNRVQPARCVSSASSEDSMQ
jgi:hypothetical protein